MGEDLLRAVGGPRDLLMGPDRGVFERMPLRFPDPPKLAGPLTREGLVELLDAAVGHARGPVPLPIYAPIPGEYAGGKGLIINQEF